MLARITESWNALPDWLKLAVLSLVMLIPLLGLRPLWLPDEGRYAEVAREMIVSGDWLTPQLNFAPHLTKPPLTYWLIAVFILVFGKTAFATRLVSALALTGTALLTAGVSRELGMKKAAFLSGLLVLLSPMIYTAGNLVTTDMLLSFWEILALYLIWRSYNRQPAGRKSLYLAYAVLGLAFLTKGPVGVLVPFLALVGAGLLSRDWRILRHSGSWIGLLILVVIGFSWYAAMVYKDEALWREFLGKEVVGRVLTNVHHRNNTFLIYPAVLLAGFLPWTVFLFSALRWFAGWAKLRARSLPVSHAFLIGWIVLPLVFFSLTRSRLPLYVLSLFIPMAVLTAAWAKPEPRAEESISRLFLWVKMHGLTRPIVITAIVLLAFNLTSAFMKSEKNLYPLVKSVRDMTPPSDYRLYATRGNLYSLNFYLEKHIVVENAIEGFLADSGPAFLVLQDPRPPEEHPKYLFKKARLIGRWYEYTLYYRPAVGS